MTTGYVFRVENPATVFYLQHISRTAHLTTLSVTSSKSDKARSSGAPATSIRRFTRTTCYFLCVCTTFSSTLFIPDAVFTLALTLLMTSRFLNSLILRRRARHVWSGAREPGVQEDLLVPLSQDRRVRLRGPVDDLKAVTRRTWLQPGTSLEECEDATATLLVYLAVVIGANMTVSAQLVFMALVVVNWALLALANRLTDQLRMFGRVVSVESVSGRYGRRLELAEELIDEVKRDDWAVKLGMIGADKVRYNKVKDAEVIM